MKIVKVNTKSKKYNVYIGSEILLSKDFLELQDKNVVVISDKKTFNLHKTKITKAFRNVKKINYIVLPFSEKNKTVDYSLKICERLLKIGTDRNSLIVSVGGGVTGDIVGFVASVYMRGIPFIHIPTTFLSQIDSSIGGKTGVNFSNAKNVFGTITQPEAVIVDTSFLETLPIKQIREGLSEIIKYAVTQSSRLFKFLENIEEINNKNILEDLVYESIAMKAKIISKDEKDKGIREILNFGHTVGHAIEILSGHKISHGEAVSIGMAYEAKIAFVLKYLKEAEYQRIISLLKKNEMSIKTDLNSNELIKIMKNDKKNRDGKIMFVLPNKIGSIVKKGNLFSFDVDKEIIKNVLDEKI